MRCGTGDEPAPASKATARPPEPPPVVAMDEFIETKLKEVSIELNADIDDATFLRRLSLDLRGILPTAVESFFFIGDEDEDKRAKVVVWMSDDDEVKAHAAKKLGLAVERIRSARLVDVGDGKRPLVVIDTDEKENPQALAITPGRQATRSRARRRDPKNLTVRAPAPSISISTARPCECNTVRGDRTGRRRRGQGCEVGRRARR